MSISIVKVNTSKMVANVRENHGLALQLSPNISPDALVGIPSVEELQKHLANLKNGKDISAEKSVTKSSLVEEDEKENGEEENEQTLTNVMEVVSTPEEHLQNNKVPIQEASGQGIVAEMQVKRHH